MGRQRLGHRTAINGQKASWEKARQSERLRAKERSIECLKVILSSPDERQACGVDHVHKRDSCVLKADDSIVLSFSRSLFHPFCSQRAHALHMRKFLYSSSCLSPGSKQTSNTQQSHNNTLVKVTGRGRRRVENTKLYMSSFLLKELQADIMGWYQIISWSSMIDTLN